MLDDHNGQRGRRKQALGVLPEPVEEERDPERRDVGEGVHEEEKISHPRHPTWLGKSKGRGRKMNPKDGNGSITTCDYCQSTEHLWRACDAPSAKEYTKMKSSKRCVERLPHGHRLRKVLEHRFPGLLNCLTIDMADLLQHPVTLLAFMIPLITFPG